MKIDRVHKYKFKYKYKYKFKYKNKIIKIHLSNKKITKIDTQN